MKKSLSVFMIFVLVTAALLATGQKEQVQVQETEKVGDGWFHKYETPITLSGNRITSSSTDFTENSYTDWAERTLGINYELKWAAPNADTDEQKLTLAMASNDLPDIITIKSGDLFARLVRSGTLMPLDDLYDEYASPLTKHLIDLYQTALGDKFFSLFTIDGKIYAFPEASDVFSANWKTLWIRKDILAELGLPQPGTIEEFEKVLAAYKEAHPEGVGFVLATDRSLDAVTPIMDAFGAFPQKWTENGSGKLEYGSTQPQVKEALETLNRWYENGYIDREYFIKDPSKNREPLVAGDALAIYGNWWYALWPFPDLWKNVPSAEMTALEPLIGPDGTQFIMHDLRNGYFDYGRAISSSCEHPEALFYLLNEELDSQFRFDEALRAEMKKQGYEFKYPSEQWQLPQNPDAPQEEQVYNYMVEGPDKFWNTFTGNPVNLPFGFKYNERPYDLFDRYVRMAAAFNKGDMESLNTTDYIDYKEYFSDPPNKIRAHVADVEVYNSIKDKDIIRYNRFTTSPTATMLDRQAYLDKIEDEYFTKIITGQLPVDAFDDYVSEWKKAGGDAITEEVNDWWATAAE